MAVTKIYPMDDSYVASNTPDSNFGTEPHLIVGKTTWAWKVVSDGTVYLKFDLTKITGTKSARLNLYLRNVTEPYIGSRSFEARLVEDVTWTENNITWNNKPTYGDVLDTIPELWGPWGYKTWDVSSGAIAKEGGLLSLMIRAADPTTTYMGGLLDSKEDGNKPYLEVEYEAPPAPKIPWILLLIPVVGIVAYWLYKRRR